MTSPSSFEDASAKARPLVLGANDMPDTRPKLALAVREMNGRGTQQTPWVIAKDVQSEKVEWLWYGRVARGKYAVLDGDPGQGKSGVTIDLAARISKGAPMPGETGPRRREPCGVVLISYEDGAADTIRPRLEAAGADLARVAIFDLGETPTLDQEGLTTIESAIAAVEAVLVVIDPLVAGIDDKKDSNNDHQMRRSLKHLVALCERRRVAILGVRHRVKGQHKNAVNSGGGSIGIIGAARVGLMAAGDPDALEDRHAHVLAVSKCNLAPMQPTLKYRTVGAAVRDRNGQEIETQKIEWLGESALSGDAIVAREAAHTDRRDVVSEVTKALRQLLKEGPLPATEVCEKLGREKDDWALKKAKERLQVRAQKERGKGKGRATRWVWELPIPNLKEQVS